MNGFKTVSFGAILALISIFSNAEMQEFISANIPALGSIIGTVVIVLRALTSSDIFKGK